MAFAAAAFDCKESLLQELDFDRPCSAAVPGERCWLNSDLTQWNRVLHRLAFELIETKRGGLRFSWENMEIARDPDSVSRDAAFLASQLLCHHACIDELELRCVADTGRLETPAFFIVLRPSSSAGESVRVIRSLDVCEMPFEEARRQGTLYTLQGVDAIGCLETLLFRSHGYKTKFTSDLGALLQHNRNSLKFVHAVCSEEAMNSRDRQIQAAGQSFEGLNIFDTFTAIDAIQPLFRASTHLRELTVNVHGSELAVFAEAVTTIKTLAKLFVLLHKSTPAVLFDVLKVNSTLNWLCVTFSLLSPDCERALASALRTNATLRHLELSNFQCTSSLVDLAEALSDNSTLEFLELNTSSLQITTIAALCRALSTNKTLKTLALRLRSGFGTHDERAALADELTHSGSYSRICVPLAEPDLPGLTVILASVTACPQELDFSNIWHFKNDLLISLFDAVATSYVSSLRVIVPNDPGAKGVLFCKMLKKVGNLRCMDLVCRELFARKVLRAVALNSSIDRLIISIVDPVYLRTAEALSYMLAHNESLTEVSVDTAKNCFGESAARGIARALSQNRRITHLSLPFAFRTDSSDSFAILEALRNNHRDLHRAIHFAILPTADRLCAEAFELFCGSPVFRRQLVAVGGAPQAEVTRILNSARNYLLDNYLVIAGVVRQNVVRCHPSSAATQADALTNDCWRAIARYLKVSDVILN
ncbi:uncharacterized protein LOC125942255 [Dermacentor silvarum]|uniref:uncharacterized protein LOC125942255 n=1 Tax=Dermacentor silvarum TaxID=543639 RepID=UPI002100BB88|nr:uncharacterized protein LOC125942255 [Dermacentor silvarum]